MLACISCYIIGPLAVSASVVLLVLLIKQSVELRKLKRIIDEEARKTRRLPAQRKPRLRKRG